MRTDAQILRGHHSLASLPSLASLAARWLHAGPQTNPAPRSHSGSGPAPPWRTAVPGRSWQAGAPCTRREPRAQTCRCTTLRCRAVAHAHAHVVDRVASQRVRSGHSSYAPARAGSGQRRDRACLSAVGIYSPRPERSLSWAPARQRLRNRSRAHIHSAEQSRAGARASIAPAQQPAASHSAQPRPPGALPLVMPVSVAVRSARCRRCRSVAAYGGAARPRAAPARQPWLAWRRGGVAAWRGVRPESVASHGYGQAAPAARRPPPSGIRLRLCPPPLLAPGAPRIQGPRPSLASLAPGPSRATPAPAPTSLAPPSLGHKPDAPAPPCPRALALALSSWPSWQAGELAGGLPPMPPSSRPWPPRQQPCTAYGNAARTPARRKDKLASPGNWQQGTRKLGWRRSLSTAGRA